MKTVRVQLVLSILALAAIYPSKAAASTPGFQGTINNYGVGMNPDDGCRVGRQCSQWFHFQFQAFPDGTVQAPFTITNDSMNGFCGRAVFVVKDHPDGKILGVFQSPRYCIAGKGADTDHHERREQVVWTFQTDPAVGQNGGDLYGYGTDYQDLGPNWDQVIPEGQVILKVAEAILQ
jgi:hypothetical protein